MTRKLGNKLISLVEKEMIKSTNLRDDKLEKEKQDIVDKLNEVATSKKLYALNDPKILMYVGGFASALLGFT